MNGEMKELCSFLMDRCLTGLHLYYFSTKNFRCYTFTSGMRGQSIITETVNATKYE